MMNFDTFRDIPLLSVVSRETLDALYAQNKLRIHHYTKGAVVHMQHEHCTTLDIVLKGSLAAYSLSENGSALPVSSFKPGAIIGANLLFGTHDRYPLNIYSLSESMLVALEREAVLDLLHQYPFVIEYVKSLSMNAQGIDRKITMMMHHNLRANLLEYLQQQSIAQKSNTITLPITKKQLADTLGVQRPSLFRELKKLKDEQIIIVNNREITLNYKT